ncbi:hypothetical protein [Streptomyces sp. NPDC058295]|uniref:hypothetical protein n=1 Tax=Streptomyces sp. NPDC058295 TaxID=3346431 RepID=UPI0036E8BD01
MADHGNTANALQRTGIAASREDRNINATSLGRGTARDPLRAPWVNCPRCIRRPVTWTIGAYAVATVETSAPVLTRLLQAAGLDARRVRPPGNADLQQGDVMEIHQQEQLKSVALLGGLTMTPGWTL